MLMAKSLLLITGVTGTGKSTSLENIPNQDKWIYFNCDAGKELPFPHNFMEVVVTDPKVIPATLADINSQNMDIEGIIIDTLTFMLEMYVSKYVNSAEDGFEGWKNYGEFFRDLIQDKIPGFKGNVILLAHVERRTNKDERKVETVVPVAGKLAKTGIEAYFTNVINTVVKPLDELKEYANPSLVITDEEKLIGAKNVFQTRKTADTLNGRIRSPRNMWKVEETFIDNDIIHVLNRQEQFYKKK